LKEESAIEFKTIEHLIRTEVLANLVVIKQGPLHLRGVTLLESHIQRAWICLDLDSNESSLASTKEIYKWQADFEFHIYHVFEEKALGTIDSIKCSRLIQKRI